MHDPPPPLSSPSGDIPVGLEAVILRCLEKEASFRFATVAELAAALCPLGPPRCEVSLERIEHVLSHAPVQPPAPSTSVESSGGTLSPSFGAAHRTRGRLLIPAALGGAGIILGTAVLLALRFPGRSPPAVLPVPPAIPAAESTMNLLSPPSSELAPLSPTPTTPSSTGTAAFPSPPSRPGSPTHRAPSPAADAAACKVVTFYDTLGNKRFKSGVSMSGRAKAILLAALGHAAILGPRLARADDAECVAASEESLALEQQGKLRDAVSGSPTAPPIPARSKSSRSARRESRP